MKTSEFLDLLKNNSGKTLEFEYPTANLIDRLAIPPTYHITEIKNTQIDAVDCGGNYHQFNETITQLWVDKQEKLRKPWTTDKASSIYNIVDNARPMDKNAEIRFEYGSKNLQTIIYSVGHVIITQDKITVQLANIPTACKPRNAANNEIKSAVSCC